MFNKSRIKELEEKVEYLQHQFIECELCGSIVNRDKIIVVWCEHDAGATMKCSRSTQICKRCAKERGFVIEKGTVIEKNSVSFELINDAVVKITKI
ncbi:MAG: hypothetical protein PHW12_00210 [Smithella sp.]|nr:hypothetical protein [Smithella sp.]